jgi:truncated hemoglobin YjbI
VIDYGNIFDASYSRVLNQPRRAEAFVDTFYQKFIASSQAVSKKFEGVDMERQKRVLRRSLGHLSTFFIDETAGSELETLAEMHSRREKDIEPALYDLWLECLIESLREHDPDFDDEVELSWRLCLSAGITYMKFKYD